jgi:hypothetical protein
MTELNIAYDDYKPMNDENDYQPQHQQPQMPQQQPQMPQQQQQLPQQPPPQNNYYIQQQAQQPPPQPIKRNRYPEYSFWDRMAMSRSDVFKLVLLSFVIVLGISIEKLGSHYITQYLADNVLSPLQEFIVRITYPVLIFLFLWIIKSL